MNLTEIQDLIKFVSRAGVQEVEIEQKDFKIVIKADPERKPVWISTGSQQDRGARCRSLGW